MNIFQMMKNGFETAAFGGALGTMFFWAEIVTSFTS
jgi:hypothetical protein